MATRCIIAEPYGDGWRGRYSHWDGAPHTKLPQLFTLVKRDGIETVRKVLLHDNYSWSSIDPDAVAKPDGDYWTVVAGYGEVHDDLDEKLALADFFTQADTQFAWAEYLYILGDASVLVFDAVGDEVITWDFVGEYRYDSELSLA